MTDFQPPTFKLSSQQRDFLKQKLQQKKLGNQARQSIKPQGSQSQGSQSQQQPDAQATPQATPLSYAQEWMWLLEQIASPDYNNPLTIRLEGTLNIEALARSLAEIVQRHSVLRTTLSVSDEGINQIAHPHWPLALKQIDLSHIPTEAQQQEAWKLIERGRCKPFNLIEEPPIRFTLLHLTNTEKATDKTTESWLHITWHHIASDDTSFSIFIRELSDLYEAFSQSQPSPLKTLPIQYEDYALWQRQSVVSNGWDKPLGFWRQHLKGGDNVLALPKARNIEAANETTAQVEFSLSGETTEQIKAFSRQHQVTLFTTLLSAFRILLYRYTHQTNLRIGVPVSLRTHAELQGLLGVFINTLAIQLDVSDFPSSQALLKRSQHIIATAQDNQDIPLHKLMGLLQSEDQNFDANIPVIFDFQSVSPLKTVTDTLTLTPLENKTYRVSAPLTLHIEDTPQAHAQTSQIQGAFYFNPQKIDHDIVQSMAEHFHVVLQSMMAAPQTPITQLPLLSAAEKHLLLTEWNNTQTEYPHTQCIHQLFEAQVARSPEAIAIAFEGQQLTYQALNDRANQLAHHLQSIGVGPDVLVGICAEPSLEMMVGILAILKAGGAYVPLDPAYPSERLAHILTETSVPVLLTQQTLKTHLPAHSATVIPLDAYPFSSDSYSKQNLSTAVTPAHLAYVIYTSGSTGKPKGVMIQHQGLCNLATATQKLLHLAEHKRCLQSFSLSFDGSVWSTFPTLISGATLYLIRKEQLIAGENLIEWLDNNRINVVTMPPALLSALPPHPLPHLTSIVAGGEACSPRLVEQWSTNRQFFNAYGPTETTVCATIAPVTSAAPPVPIGRPIANTQTYILDAHLQPVPIGVPGELWIGGVGLARGYLHQPELTEKRFIPHPFYPASASNQASPPRLYKTGDLARYLPDGQIEYLGRIDHQVKVRGFRIELGEIEAVLSQHAQIENVVVTLHEDEQQNQQLVAYLSSLDKETGDKETGLKKPGVTELRQFIKQHLPNYMVPSTFVFLESFPLTPNGKIDRQSLPKPDPRQRGLDKALVEPTTPTEKQICHIWCEVLKQASIGIHDNFFELGGHSLSATQVISRIREFFSLELPLRTIFEHPTIAELASRITDQQSISAQQQSDNLQETAVTPPIQRAGHLPLSPAQKRLWLLHQLAPETTTYTMPKVSRLSGSLNIQVLERSLNEIILRHEILRTKFKEINGQPAQLVEPRVALKLPVRDLQNLPKSAHQDEVARLADDIIQHPFNLQQAPPIRFELLVLSPTEHVLIISVHHIAFDGWSFDLFFQELSFLYAAFCQERPSPLPALKVQYADFSNWQQQQFNTKGFQHQLNYWMQQLSGPLPLLQLPTDYPRPSHQDYRGDTKTLTLPQQITTQLKALSRASEVTLFMTLLAALNVLLHRHSNQTDIIIGMPIAGRPQVETEKLIGLFLNTLALRTDLSSQPTFSQLLAQVKKTTLDAYTHQNVPFDQLVKALNPERSLSRHPIFEVMLNFANMPTANHALGEVKLSPISMEQRESKFSITLYVNEQQGELHLKLVYQKALFTAARMEDFLQQFKCLLEQIVVDSTRPIDAYSLVSEQAKAVLPDPALPLSVNAYQSVWSLISNWGETSPAAPAIAQGSQNWSYGELTKKAKRLAQYLLSQGVTTGDVIAVSGDRSFGLITSIVGVLQAGGVLLLIDPQLPKSRRLQLIAEAKATRLLRVTNEVTSAVTHEFTNKTVTKPDSLPLHSIHPDTAEPSANPLENPKQPSFTHLPLPVLQPDDPAYIFFTSGTTDVPKGVLGSHQGLVHFLKWQQHEFKISPTDRIGQLTGLSFDVVLRDIFLPLISGGTLCLPAPDSDLSAAQVIPWLAQQNITVLHTVPTLAKTWVMDRPQGLKLPQLRWVFFAGEPLSHQLVNQWREAFSSEGNLVNLYGPTETTLAKCHYRIPEEPAAGIQSIGKSISETQALIFTRSNQRCTFGEVGEIVLRTPFHALGYLNVATEHAQRFRPNPYGNQPDERLYYTGDLGRYHLDGTIQILGRADRQVKIRGVRVELAEVESIIISHTAIQSVIVIDDQEQGIKRLIAYVVSHPESALKVSELHLFLRQRLPNYMLPSAIVLLESLPLTPNGKIDRNALPKPDTHQRLLENLLVEPTTLTEKKLCQIWCEVLQKDSIGIHDNFFELGGHSLLAVQVISRIRETFAIELNLRILFEFPTVAGLETVLDEQDFKVENARISAIASSQSVPLSFAQQRLWFLNQLEGPSATYNIPQAIQLSGSLNVSALEQALNEIIRRHESLRTTFKVINDEPVPVISKHAAITLPVLDLCTTPQAKRSEKIQQLANELAAKPFDIGQDLLIRIMLFQQEPEVHTLVIVMHHIVSDGWSMGVLTQELSTLYQDFSQGRAPSLPELPIQYTDFAHWQRQYLNNKRLNVQLNYWQHQLADAPALLELPTDYPRPPVQSFQGGVVPFELDKTLSQKLQTLSQKSGTTLFVTLLSAFAILLYRYSKMDDIVIGSPIANRNRRELEPLIGFFVNTVLLRIKLANRLSFTALLEHNQQTALEAYTHQDLPFEKLVEELNPERTLSYQPLFQVMFVLHNTNAGSLTLPDLQLKPVRLERHMAKFDLNLAMRETETGLVGIFEYNSDLFKAERIQRLAQHFSILLQGIVEKPETPITHLPLLAEREQHQILVEWNSTQASYLNNQCLHQLFEAQAERTPEALAVTFEGQQLTYRELNTKANQLAHHLQSLQVGPEVLVGICLERSIEMLVSLLGVLKAGGAYVPLDPTYPEERLAYMLEDTQVSVLLTNQKLAEQLPAYAGTLLCLDSAHLEQTLWQDSTLEQQQNPTSSIQPNNLAYVIYTSGSTGKPKGVMNAHQGIVNRLLWMQEKFNLTPEDRVLQKTPFSFDISIWEFFWPLLTGITLVIARPEGHKDPDYLRDLIIREQVTIAHFVPSMLRIFVEAENIQACRTLKRVMCGGEALSLDLQNRFFQRLDCELHNLYGPTEAAVEVSHWQCDANSALSTVPIGQPIANTQLYILDTELNPVPIGVTGELHIGGVQLARGYHNRPELTAERFIQHKQLGARLYKTGDLCRHLPDGNIEYIGRMDAQVKIRGFRIELGEVESVLNRHEAVSQVVAIAREDPPGDKRLVAYVVASPSKQPTTQELRAFLQAKLPDYMVPSAFVLLDALPLMPNGKINRRALPKPSQPSVAQAFVAPTTALEEQLCRIWCDVIRLENIGIHDNFFELGGHSLLATQVIARIQKELAIKLPLRTLFELPTVDKLATGIETLQWMQNNQSASTVQTTPQPEATTNKENHGDSQEQEEREEFEF
ncbi:MAG: amino acid adenylation domain-containing protein [Phormidesmis sp.]